MGDSPRKKSSFSPENILTLFRRLSDQKISTKTVESDIQFPSVHLYNSRMTGCSSAKLIKN